MRLDRSLVSSATWIVLVVLSAAMPLSACSGDKHGDDDDDDDDAGQGGGSSAAGGKGGQGGTSAIPPGALGSTCDASHACDDDLRCYSGICIPDSTGTGGSTGTEQGTL